MNLIGQINDFISVLGADIKNILNKLDNIQSPSDSMITKYEEETIEYIYYGGTIGDKKIVNRFSIYPFKKQQAIGEWADRYNLTYEDV